MNNIKKGQKVKGIVKNIKPYGAFIQMENGETGLAYIEDLSVARIKSPYDRFELGEEINVVVKSIDEEHNKIFLSYKDALGSWEENASKFEEGQKTVGIVREAEKNKNGIFVELTPNLVGMVEYQEGLEYGQNIEVVIKKIIPEKKKVKLLKVD